MRHFKIKRVVQNSLMKIVVLVSFLLMVNTIAAQVVINELDVDTPSTDDKEIVELVTAAPFESLDGFVLVLFNGSTSGGDRSYFALDLDGLISDQNGVVLIGSNDVSPVPDFILFDNTIQNGADAIAIYEGDEDDFLEGTLATTNNLIDALVYDTNDSDDSNLLSLLGETEQINEGGNGPSASNSIQRNATGGYDITPPTPGRLNDGSGIPFITISYAVQEVLYQEGASFDIVFTASETLTAPFSFLVTLNNGGFDTSDFTGTLALTIPEGSDTVTTTITTINDTEDEGDEEIKISFAPFPSGFKRGNDNLIIRLVDDDFTTASWGTPLSPTFGQVTSTQPEGYYDPINGLAGESLVQALQDIIANPEVVRAQTYTDVIDILKRADQSPLNSNQVWLVYTEQQRPKLDFQTAGGSNIGLWNREHTYPRSRGGFFDIEDDETGDGIDIFTTTEADSLRHANSDAHGLRAADGPENSSRGNQDYGEYSGPDGNLGSFYGDVARGIFFLTLRYNGLEVLSGDLDNNTVGTLGDLDILLEWHRIDPPDDYEMNRNNIVYEWQFNRNPFIDLPDLAEYIWGNNLGEIWENPLSIPTNRLSDITIFPNPSTSQFVLRSRIKGILSIYDTLGHKVYFQEFSNTTVIPHHLPSGIYIVQLESTGLSTIRKLIVR